MHQLALDLHNQGHTVTGSDDEIFDPSKSVLYKNGLLPANFGWFPVNIHKSLDLVILGMHAKKNNPELLKAKDLGIPVQSFAEFVFEHSKHKKRVVIGGSHGKTTITSMVMHVLKDKIGQFDYLVGARLKGFDQMVSITKKADLIVLEGDEYLSSAIEMRPKFHFYKPQVALLSGIAWDHMNVFPTFENYLEQFKIFIDSIESGGVLTYFAGDEHLQKLVDAKGETDISFIPYDTPKYEVKDGQFILEYEEDFYPLNIIGKHNLQNLNGALQVCLSLGISAKQFYKSIQSFQGAARRMELVEADEERSFYMDFAHAPSKVKATTRALKEMYPDRRLVALVELHTYSSLNKDFLSQFEATLSEADTAIVFYSPHTLEIKKLPPISALDVVGAFGHRSLDVYTDVDELRHRLETERWINSNLLIMTSGKLGGIKREDIATFIFNKTQK